MNIFIRNIAVIVSLLPLFITNSNADLIAKDDFEAGTWGSFWGSLANTTVSPILSKDGSYAARFQYPGVAITEDGWAEARFDLGGYYEQLSIRFDLYVPLNYEHRDSGSGNNNKFFRLWNETYNDLEKIGATTYNESTSGESGIGSDYRLASSWGMSSSVKKASDFITTADKGNWVSIVIYIKAATDSKPAELRIYKNGRLHLEDKLNINYVPGTQGYRHGYLLGWSNSGFTQETIFYIDNVEFHDNDIMSATPSTPSWEDPANPVK